MKKFSIYSLNDPETGNLKYIGKTGSRLKDRLNSHIRESRNKPRGNKKDNWIKCLLKKGLKPTINLLEECEDNDKASEREITLIKEYTENGYDLKNTRPGGEGSPPGTPFPHRYQAPKGVIPPQFEATIKTVNIGRKHSQEHKDNLSKMRKGKPVPARCVPVEVVDIVTQTRIEFQSAKHAASFLNVTESRITNSCKKKNMIFNGQYTAVSKGESVSGISTCYIQPVTVIDSEGVVSEFRSLSEASKHYNIPREVLSYFVKLEVKDKYGRSWQFKIKSQL